MEEFGVVGEEGALEVESLVVVADGGACLLRPEVAVVHLGDGGVGQGAQKGEVDAVPGADFLGEGIDGVAEVVDHHGGEVRPAALPVVEAVDVVADGSEEFFDGFGGLGGAAFDAEGQVAVVHGDVAHKSLRRPYNAVAVGDRGEDVGGSAAGGVEHQGTGEAQGGGEVVEGVVVDGEEIE